MESSTRLPPETCNIPPFDSQAANDNILHTQAAFLHPCLGHIMLPSIRELARYAILLVRAPMRLNCGRLVIRTKIH